MLYKYLLFDLDETLFDYQAAETAALNRVLQEYDVVEYAEQFKKTYHLINNKLWSDYEKGLVQKDEILATRFSKTVAQLKLSLDGSKMTVDYQLFLGQGYQLIDGAIKCLEKLRQQGFKLYALTNGVERTQLSRLSGSSLDRYFEKVYISEQTGSQKPFLAFYDFVFNNSPEIEKEFALMIGDSLTSDIQGAINATIDSCWYNPHQIENNSGIQATYIIGNYDELINIVSK
ncbi:YjjG family noncanonical pyrimidine nucleotidase [Kurthia sibirica]|uniref:YjjG family noncanonical pyrimidine nucleotidase n=1 Tax=Kurthia sibirica TaxID=202750 RepID=UPI00116E7621|nr:YjjG family noncanonical pyrimidine nucleotidase [Kurthia sibirica]GEK34780.1 noncanonical pyrimidine nucleotidase, YjjG family protein [Kurthia sibirica]